MMVYTNQYQYVTMVGEIIHKITSKILLHSQNANAHTQMQILTLPKVSQSSL